MKVSAANRNGTFNSDHVKAMFAKIKAYYAGMTPAQKARLWTLIITGLTGFAGIGDKIHHLGWLPGWFVNSYPVLLSLDLAILKLISIFTDPNAVAKPPVSDGLDTPPKF